MGQKDGLIREQDDLVRSQAARTAELEAHVKALKAQLAKDSRTCGKPPSSDGLKEPPQPKSEGGKSGRSSGGQKGHAGQTLTQTDRPNRVIYHRL